jgi:hypothetical protein
MPPSVTPPVAGGRAPSVAADYWDVGKMKRILAGNICLLATCVAVCGAGTNFPTFSSCSSPDWLWTIYSVASPDGHTLHLSKLGSSENVAILKTERSCDVLWSNDGQRLAITDWSGSNLSDIYIVEVSEPRKTVRLEVRDLWRIVSPDELDGHIYFEALNWNGPHELEIRAFGHTDENPSHGFAYYLLVDLVSGSAKMLRRVGAEHG